jgi:acetyl-CoA synthetase
MIDPTPHLDRFTNYRQAVREFRWSIPERVNLAAEILRRHEDPATRIALREKKFGGANTYTFGGLDFLSDKFANALSKLDITAGSRVVVALQPSAALAIAQLGCLKTGSVVVPIAPSVSPRLIERAIDATHPKAIILEESLSLSLGNVVRLPADITRFEVRDLRPISDGAIATKDFWSEINRCSSDFHSVDFDSELPAFIFFVERNNETVGVVHSVRSTIAQFAGFEFFNETHNRRADGPPTKRLLLQHACVYWAGDDWSSVFSLLGVIYPAWWYGCSIVANSDDSSLPQTVLDSEVTDVFLTCSLQSPSLQTLPAGTRINVAYGTAETGWVFGISKKLSEPHADPGCRVVPGRLVEIVDSKGRVLPFHETGQLAIHRSDVGLFNEYLGVSEQSSGADWFLIGKSGYKDVRGVLHIEPDG